MTVKTLKRLLNFLDNDNARVILDNGERYANPANEFIYAVHPEGSDVLVLQLRGDFDAKNQLEACFQECAKQGDIEESEVLTYLFDLGFTLDDFKYDDTRYEWAKKIADDYGLL